MHRHPVVSDEPCRSEIELVCEIKTVGNESEAGQSFAGKALLERHIPAAEDDQDQRED